MNLVEFLKHLSAQGVELWIHGDLLRYRAPKDVLTPTLLTKIKQHKAEILQLLREGVHTSRSYPLSQGQRGLWFLYHLAPESAAYNFAFTARIRSDLDVPALRRAFQSMIVRHPTLRTTFSKQGSEPVQEVHAYQEVCFEETDASTWNWDELTRRMVEAYQRPFDLERGPVLRVSLFTRSVQDHILLLTIHHIAHDGWSLWVLLDELRLLYSAEKANRAISLPPLNCKYTDYVQWQAEMLASSVGEQLWTYWHKQLAGELPVLNLPTDRPRPPVQTYQGASHAFKLTEELTQRLKRLAQAEGATIYMTLLATFQVLLHRYTGQEDILVGSPTAGRSQAEFAGIIGYFVNPVVLRANLFGNPTFKAFLSQVRHTVMDAIAHQDYPFPLLVERLATYRDSSRSPIFQVSFILQKQQSAEIGDLLVPGETGTRINSGGLKLEPFEMAQQEGQFDLTLDMVEGRESYFGVFNYNTDLFDAATITRMAGHFQTLLEGIVANPEQRVSDLPLLSVAQRHQILVEWNDTEAEYPLDLCIHQLFEAQVKRTPDAPALVFVDQQLTYRELNARANKIAHHLQVLGVGPEVLVGICMERSIEMVVGLLGILKAGGAYVPLDPAYSKERLAYMLSDAQVPVLLTQENLVAGLAEHGAHVVCLNTNWGITLTESEENPVSGAKPTNSAYALYTSGSTGRPKGVQIMHRTVVNFLNSMRLSPGLTDQDTLLSVTTITFDIAALELFLPLTVGARVVVVSREVAADGAQLLEQLVSSGATVMQATPATWRLLLAAGWATAHPLKILCGGEALPRELANQLLLCGASLWNLYGPTETTIWSAIHPVDSKEGSVPIGRPIANTQIYILDHHLQPVPIGVPGELHIGGAGLARGYLNRPQLTEEKFIPNPFSDEPGVRLYKTGDLARYNSDGNIEYLGRIDHQVKIRGFRIELGEIEAVLAGHPAVRETVVIAREDVPGDKRLVAYLVPEEPAPTGGDLRCFLKQQLPDYMVPSAFVMLKALPLTPNGKVDRRALPAPNTSRQGFEAGFVAPRTPTEEVLAVIWADILGLEQVGIYNSLFELGGHSLLGTQIISRVRDTFSVELPLRCLFESPTVAGLSEQIQAARHENQSQQVYPIRSVDREGKLPLSFAQQRLWFIDQLEGGSATYNMPAALHLRGPLHVVALQMAVQEIVRRHEVLRTTFPMVNGSPVQVVADPTRVKMPEVDLQSLPEVEQSGEVRRLAQEEAQRPFDLATGPLVRVTLLQLGSESHVLLTTIHHIVFDGWSIGVFIQELATLYKAFSSNQPSPLPELPIQYADFAHWQRQWLQGEVLETQLNYWKQQLAGAPSVLELPTDRPHPPVQTFRGSYELFQLNPDVTRRLLTLSQKSGATLYMTLLAAFALLLSRYSGQEDIVVGSPIANRNRSETESLIGFFLNTLVLRTQLQGNPTFTDLLARVRQVTLDAYAHQDVPFEQLVEAWQPERHLSHSLWFQVMFVLQNAPMGKLELPSLDLTPLEIETAGAKFDLTLSMTETQQGLMGWLEYKTDLFDAATITRMVGHFQTLLEAIVANPQQQVAEFPLLTPAERHQLLVQWNDTEAEYPFDKCIHQVFEAQVERTPDAPALVFDSQQLTYRELNCRANKIAHHLQALGVGPEVLVGLAVKRSISMVVGLLGILKAGGAYVPLDPAYPKERLALMMSDSQVSVLLTQQQLVAELPETGAHVVCLDTDWEVIAHESEENLVTRVTPENLAYVIYTSGSTGKPKGVMIQHQSLVSFTQTAIVEYGLSARDRVLQFASISFDTAAEEIYPCLTCGGMLVLRTDEMLSSVAGFLEKCREMDLTVLDLPTAYWHQMTSELALSNLMLPASLRLVIIGGERALPEQVAMWRERVGDFPSLVNTYGPTEATVVATNCLLSDTESLDGQEVPIGRALSNVQVYVLDRYLQPVPIGVEGELHIGGAGLARGYLNRPDLTEAKFIPNPFSDEPGVRLYKTGDLARYLPDGNIEYLGRIDDQVKIRGFRIELGEVEAVLAGHPAVRETVVIAREDVPGDKRLVAYLVSSQEEAAPTGGDLRRFLKEQLPDYMVPSAFIILKALPLTPNGKVDRRALPAPDTSERNRSASLVVPRTPIEEVLAVIWAEVLRVEVGIHDNFFELGGHSLLATQLISRVRDTFSVELPLRCLFESPTVAELGEAIEVKRHQNTGLMVPAIEPVPRDGELPVSFAQARLWFLDQLEEGSATYNMPAALHLRGALNVHALEQAVTEIVRRHEILRTTFPMVNGSPVQEISHFTKVKMSEVDLQPLPEVEQSAVVQRLAQEEAQRPFDLATGPLVRVTLLQLGSESHVLLTTIHHIVFDGWSLGVFIQELTTLYKAFSSNQPSPLPELPIQYADFAHWQRQWLQGEVLETQLNYWKQQLAGAPPVLELPTDRPHPPVQTFRGSYEFVQLNPDVTRRLLTLSKESGATLYMTLLAAFALLLSRYSGQEDIVVGSPIANRNRSETESLIGFFLNTLVLRTQLQGNPTFADLLARVRQVTLDAYAHQDVPFEQLVEAWQPERSLSHSLWFQVMFVLQNAPIEKLELPGLDLTPVGIESSGAKFDLLLSMTETQQGLMGWLEYKTDLFDAATITRMVGHFQTLLSAIVANPQQRVSEFPLLTAAERHQLLVDWNSTEAEYPLDSCIHQLFEAQVELTPDAPALVCDSQQLTYRELNCRANKIAHHLQALGVGPEVLVGLAVKRSIEMIVGLLGILKAGGAYVPLDPAYPQERLALMLSDSQVSVLLTQQQLVVGLPDTGAHVVFLDTDWGVIERESEENLATRVTPENLAYVIYTSGSTGKPKGVMIQHQSLVSFTQTAIVEYGLSARDRVLQFASISFDTAAEEIYPCLTCGGMLVLRTDEMLSSLAGFLEKCQEMDLTVLDLPTAYWHQMTSELALGNLMLPASLRLVIIGGERVLPEQVGMWRARVGDFPSLVNTYGPTEATVVATNCLLSDTESLDGQEVPIGRAVSNVQVYLLDQYLQPVPIGVEGELHIGGAGLARGYLNRPDLTEAKFIPNPFSDEPGARLYKTGDLARYLPDGNIEYLGRIDDQVKIRGFRIELGEIEAVLASHPAVRETVVIAREDVPGDKRLVAYLVLSQEPALTIVDLRRFLRKKLPDYMVPNAFVMLDSLPLSPNGKVDRRLLPVPDKSGWHHDSSRVAPRTPTEEVLVAIWTEVLRVEVGIHDNFFELGGHSLLATQVISRVREAFCVELPLRCLFESPTVAELGEAIEAKRHQNTGLMVPAILPVPRDGELPVSFAQARMWFLDQLEGGSATYNMPAAVRLQGPLNVHALEQAITEIVRRHEILRTRFPMVNGSPVQEISHPTRVKMPEVDLQSLSEVEQSAVVQRLAQEEAERPFDLFTGPLLRVTLLRLGSESHVLLLTMHHIIADGWSMEIFIREEAALYEAFSTAAPSPLPELPIQYADFSHWQRQWLQGEVLETQLNYWKQQLAGAPPLLTLPTDRPRPSVQSFRGSTEPFLLAPELSQQLKTLSQQSGATLYMTLLAAFVTLLCRYSGQDDIVVGSPIANRNRSETDSLIGLFVNTLVLRTDMKGNPSFSELLTQVRQVALDAYAHQDVPFEQLVEALQPKRSLSHTPLFQVMFALENAPIEKLGLPGLDLTPLAMESSLAKFDLSLSMLETESGLIGSLEYNTDLFDAATIARMAGHFKTLLSAIVANPQQQLKDLPLNSVAERHQILVKWNDTEAEYPLDLCIHQLFEQQVERTPDAPAVVFKDQQLTYRELNCRANQLAHYLMTLGVGPDVLVGICVERSLEMVVGLLGILKAGGAYVPLDPAYPSDRLAFMLEDAQVPVLLTQKQLVESLPERQAHVVCLDDGWEVIAQESEENPVSGVTPDNLAYVIYTSGSTGKPKGVLLAHQGLVNHCVAVTKQYGLQSSDRILQFSSISFDIALEELFPFWMTGAVVILRSFDMLSSSTDFLQAIAQERLTVLNLPTAYWHQWVSSLSESNKPLPETLRLVVVGGEKVSPTIFSTWGQLPGVNRIRWLNAYGPTETTVTATVYEPRTLPETQGATFELPIGRPIANTQIYLLDQHLQPVPIGVRGELHIGGAGLARGYLNRPELTEEKFIPNPFSDRPGARLYKTGDNARYLPDGNIQFLGRLDDQVKIRGFRIELGEVEAVLAGHPAVLQTIAIAREDVLGDKRLVAYIVPNHEQAPTGGELRCFLKQQLPEYMVPSAFVMLDSLPLTPNGKVDHRALPAPDLSRSGLEVGFVPPRTPTEEVVANLWAEVLGLEQVGIYDNFFELGGHSLLVIQLISRMRDTFSNVELPLRTLFEFPTAAGVAEAIDTILQTGTSARPLCSTGETPAPQVASAIATNTVTDLNAEAVLDPTIRPEAVPVEYVTEPDSIFLTGATGFLGAFLLHELLQQTQADIYCLIRSPNADEGTKRLQSKLESYSLWNETFSSRIIPVVGELSEPLLGLSEQQFRHLASLIDVIYHNGASVNFIYPYSQLKAANVLGTQEVLRLASLIKAKPVHFISTLSVFSSPAYSELKVVQESDPLDYSVLAGGYAQSKWVAEKLVMRARDRGLTVSIYRPGTITGDSQTGVCNTDDLLCRTIKGCIQLGRVVDLYMMLDMMVEMIPVDYVSRAIVHLSRQKESRAKAFHLVNPRPMPVSDLVNWFRSLGYPLEQVSYDKWRAELIHHAERSSENAMHPLLPLFSEEIPSQEETELQEPQFDCQNTLDGLAGTDIVCPPVDTELLSTYFSYFMSCGFLDAPQLTNALNPQCESSS